MTTIGGLMEPVLLSMPPPCGLAAKGRVPRHKMAGTGDPAPEL